MMLFCCQNSSLRAVAHGLDQPVLVFRRELQRRGAAAERQVGKIVEAVVRHLVEHGGGGRIARRAAAAAGVEHDPVPEPQLERAAVAHAGVAQVGHRVDGNHRGQVRRAGPCARACCVPPT